MANNKKSRNKPDGRHTPQGVVEKRSRRKRTQGKKSNFNRWSGQGKETNENIPDIARAPKSRLLDILLPQRHALFIPREECRTVKGSIDLQNFSFLENPVGTLKMLGEIVRMNSCAGSQDINFLDPVCWDMAPYMVLQLIGKDLDSERIRGGRISHLVKRVLEETDFVRHLNMQISDNANFLQEIPAEIWPLKLICCKQSGPEAFSDYAAPHGEVADKFTKQIEDWLTQTGFELTQEGARSLMSMISEVLNNAILHSGDDIGGEAWISGFMLKYPTRHGIPRYACNISILNLGHSIFQSMQSCSGSIRNEIESLIRSHMPKFLVRQSYWNPEALWTLYALQDGVTSMHGAHNPRGGKGLMDMISFFSEIGQSSESKLAIISGNVVLNIVNPIPFINENGLRRLALNVENDLSKPPKKEYIKILRKPFPGTILTWRFFLNPSHLERLANSQNDG